MQANKTVSWDTVLETKVVPAIQVNLDTRTYLNRGLLDTKLVSHDVRPLFTIYTTRVSEKRVQRFKDAVTQHLLQSDEPATFLLLSKRGKVQVRADLPGLAKGQSQASPKPALIVLRDEGKQVLARVEPSKALLDKLAKTGAPHRTEGLISKTLGERLGVSKATEIREPHKLLNAEINLSKAALPRMGLPQVNPQIKATTQKEGKAIENSLREPIRVTRPLSEPLPVNGIEAALARPIGVKRPLPQPESIPTKIADKLADKLAGKLTVANELKNGAKNGVPESTPKKLAPIRIPTGLFEELKLPARESIATHLTVDTKQNIPVLNSSSVQVAEPLRTASAVKSELARERSADPVLLKLKKEVALELEKFARENSGSRLRPEIVTLARALKLSIPKPAKQAERIALAV